MPTEPTPILQGVVVFQRPAPDYSVGQWLADADEHTTPEQLEARFRQGYPTMTFLSAHIVPTTVRDG